MGVKPTKITCVWVPQPCDRFGRKFGNLFEIPNITPAKKVLFGINY